MSFDPLALIKALIIPLMESEESIIDEIVAKIINQLPPHLTTPKIGIVCGSGLDGIWRKMMLSDPSDESSLIVHSISFESVGFGSPTIPGHGGRCLFGRHLRTGLGVICMVGRLHGYEGHTMQAILRPVRVMAKLGVETLLLTNASGSLLPPDQLDSGDFMVIEDHLSFPSLCGSGPLRGSNYGEGPRFQPCTQLYHPRSYEWVMKAAQLNNSIPVSLIKRGVYAAVGGPSYETPAECRALRALGASSVGMSTAPEAIAARHAGIPQILAISLISNVCVLELPSKVIDSSNPTLPPTHEEVLATTAARRIEAGLLVDNLFTIIYGENLI